MNRIAYFTHLDGQRYRVEVIEEKDTQIKVRFSEQTAAELKLAREIWLPKSYIKIEG